MNAMPRNQAVTLMVISTVLWSIAGVVTRHLDAAQSFEVTFWRSLANSLTLLIALSCLRGNAFWNDFRHGGWTLWLSGLCWATMYTAFMVAMMLTTVANVLVAMSVGPLIAAIFSRCFLKRRLPGATWLSIGLAGIGIAWMFGHGATDELSLRGTLIALLPPLAGACNWTLLEASADRNRDMSSAVFIGATVSALITWPLAMPFQATAHDLGLLGLLGVVQLAVPCVLAVRAARSLQATEISLLGLLEVIFGVLWVWLWGNETPSPETLTGGLLVLGALIFNELAGLHRRRARPALG